MAATFHASVGLTLFYGLFIAVPAGALIALAWPRLPFIKAMNPSIPTGLVSEREFTDEEMPGLGWSLSVALFPVVLIAGAAVTDMATSGESPFLHFVAFIGSAPIALAPDPAAWRSGRSGHASAAAWTRSARPARPRPRRWR